MNRRKFLTRTSSIMAVALSGVAIAQHEEVDSYSPFNGLNYVFIRDKPKIPYTLREIYFVPEVGELVRVTMTPEFVEAVIQMKDIPFEKDLTEYLTYLKFDGEMTEQRLTDIVNLYASSLPNK